MVELARWTEEADALLIQLWDEGGSFNYVMQGMRAAGYEVTRNAIAGRKNRLGEGRFKRKTAKPTQRTWKMPTNPPKPRPAAARPPPERRAVSARELEELFLNAGVNYLDLSKGRCKALLDKRDPHTKLPMCCGKPCGLDYHGADSVYCPTHFRLYYTPTVIKRHG